jgi:hypothetical protein
VTLIQGNLVYHHIPIIFPAIKGKAPTKILIGAHIVKRDEVLFGTLLLFKENLNPAFLQPVIVVINAYLFHNNLGKYSETRIRTNPQTAKEPLPKAGILRSFNMCPHRPPRSLRPPIHRVDTHPGVGKVWEITDRRVPQKADFT